MKNHTQSERNIRLVNLAFHCMLIVASEKEKIIAQLGELSKEEPDVIDLFRREELLSDEKIEYLLALNTHMDLQIRDQQFGRIAVANGMVSEENVTQALKYQKSCFEKNNINIKIGEILLENRLISTTDQLSILLTQNRIKNEQLLEAFNEMGETRARKDDINKRFGAFALKDELVTKAQVIDALKIQKTERTETGRARFIGEILRETAELSEDEVEEVLVRQKQFEKRRLDLEKALYTAQDELKIFKKMGRYFSYSQSKDSIEGFVKKTRLIDETIPCYEFIIWLKRLGIRFGILGDDVLEEFIQNGAIDSQILVAKGYPPEASIHESVKFYFENESPAPGQAESAPPEPEEDTSEREESEEQNTGQEDDDEKKATDAPEPAMVQSNRPLLFAGKGSILARIIPGREGRPGKTVLGNPIKPAKPSVFTLTAGSGVIRKGPDFFARIDGRPVLKNETMLMVEPLEEKIKAKTIQSSISNDTGDTYASIAVTLNGAVMPGAILKCHSLVLKGTLLGHAISSGDIQVSGDIGKPGHEAKITCGGSVRAAKAVFESKISTGGEFTAFNSTVTCSQITACKGITVKDVVAGENGPSVLIFGLSPKDKLLTLAHTIDQKKQEMAVLQKKEEILGLTCAYKKDVEEIETHQCEQTVLTTLAAIIEAPELYQYDGLEEKLTYLYNLPDFSSVKTFYLKLPASEIARKFVSRIKAKTDKMDMDHVLKYIKKKIDPEPEAEEEIDDADVAGSDESPEPAMSERERIEREFRLRLNALETEVEDNEEDIQKLENEIKGLKSLTAQEESGHLTSIPRSNAAVKIKNKCEQGTVIKGIIARLTVPETVYHVKFKEVLNPETRTASIVIDTY